MVARWSHGHHVPEIPAEILLNDTANVSESSNNSGKGVARELAADDALTNTACQSSLAGADSGVDCERAQSEKTTSPPRQPPTDLQHRTAGQPELRCSSESISDGIEAAQSRSPSAAAAIWAQSLGCDDSDESYRPFVQPSWADPELCNTPELCEWAACLELALGIQRDNESRALCLHRIASFVQHASTRERELCSEVERLQQHLYSEQVAAQVGARTMATELRATEQLTSVLSGMLVSERHQAACREQELSDEVLQLNQRALLLAHQAQDAEEDRLRMKAAKARGFAIGTERSSPANSADSPAAALNSARQRSNALQAANTRLHFEIE